MAVAKRQGREKPAKIEQKKVKGRSEDRSEDFRQNSTPADVPSRLKDGLACYLLNKIEL